MKKRFCLLLAMLVLILTLCTACTEAEGTSSAVSQSSSEPQATPSPEPTVDVSPTPEAAQQADAEPEMTQREKEWREDLAFFKKQYTLYHKAPFYYTSEEELDWQLEQMAQKVPQLSDTDLYFELAKIVAGLRDTHTLVYPTEELYEHIFPIGMSYLGDKLYLTGYWEKFDQLEPYLLHEIVSINGVDIKYLEQKAESIADPVNQWHSKTFFLQYYGNVPAFYDWAGCDYTEGYTFEFLDDDQQVVSVEMPVITQDADVGEKVIQPDGWENIPYYSPQQGARLLETEQGSCVLLFLGNTITEDEEFYGQLFESANTLLAEHPDASLVIDLRGIPGGTWTALHAVEDSIPLLKQSRNPQTYVITDGYTQSAAVLLSNTFQEELGAVQVGEPTGQFFVCFSIAGISNYELLPNSQIYVQIARGNTLMVGQDPNAFYDEDGKLYEWENAVLPDVYVSQSIEDTRQGKDSAIQWILEH